MRAVCAAHIPKTNNFLIEAVPGFRYTRPVVQDTQQSILLCWSGGKDSALALHELLQDREYRVAALLTTVTEGYERVSMHGVRRALLERQAAALELRLERVSIPPEASNQVYDDRWLEAVERFRASGVAAVAFGDIFLADVRRYREETLARLGMPALFPLWGRDTRALLERFIWAGFKAIITCVDTQVLGREFAGRQIDRQFLARLPAALDPCGENGEYHSFVYDGPLFRRRVGFRVGQAVLREERFHYVDLLPDG